MKRTTTSVGALLAGALLVVASAARASDFDRGMESILTRYLEIQAALAADDTGGVGDAVAGLEDLARKLRPEAVRGEHAEHYAKIPADLLAACGKLRRAEDIGATREAFRELSKPISMWVTMAKPAGLSVMYCPMEKAGWVQRGAEVSNPYFGSKMPRCGQKVGGAD